VTTAGFVQVGHIRGLRAGAFPEEAATNLIGPRNQFSTSADIWLTVLSPGKSVM